MLPDNKPAIIGVPPPNQIGCGMVGKISMRSRREVVSAVAERYRAASRIEKGPIFDELCAVTGWHRKHAIQALAFSNEKLESSGPRCRGGTYRPIRELMSRSLLNIAKRSLEMI